MANIMTVRAPDEIQEYLKEKAQKRGLTRNALILQILNAWIDAQKQKNGKYESYSADADCGLCRCNFH